jgi:hypothetical protein
MADTFRELCAEVLAFHHGEGCYNFSGLNPYDRDNAAFDAWQDIRQRLKSALAQPEGEAAPESLAEALAARPLLERLAQLRAQGFLGIRQLADQAAAWLRENPPGQPVAIEPRGCPTPGACSCVVPAAAPAPAVVPDAGLIDVLIKAEAILADIVEGESPVDHGPSNEHNYFAEQCGYLESELEKCEDLLAIIRSAIQPND